MIGFDFLKNENKNIKEKGFIKIPNTSVEIPYTFISGNEKGKNILITAGVHGSEYVSIETSKNLARTINPYKVSGNILILHLINVSGFEHRLARIMNEDGKNLNKNFPGDKNGSSTQIVAYYLLENLFKKSDFYIDLHGGDLGEVICPLIFYSYKGTKNVSLTALQAAEHSGFPYLVASNAEKGAYSCSILNGIPSILTELGGNGSWSNEEIHKYTTYICNILCYLEVYTTEFKLISKITYFKPVFEIVSEKNGFWYPKFKVGDTVTKDKAIGEFRDVFDNLLETVYSPVSGVILYQTVSLSVLTGSFLGAVSEVSKGAYI